jgi:chitin disaccharide deacetylase
MKPNPVLRRLGLSPNDRAVIIHADDLGMCQATLAGLEELLEAGIVTSGAIMVPCPWFRAAARFAGEHPTADLGVHVTLTSEWKTYRWGPLTTADPASGLLDAEGYFPATASAVQDAGDPAMAAREIEAQVVRALGAGIAATHIDTHMGAVAHAKYLEGYVNAALRHGLPLMLPRKDEEGWRELSRDHLHGSLGIDEIRRVIALTRSLEERGIPLIDGLTGLSLSSDPAHRLEEAKAVLAALNPGVTHFIIHPALDTPELRAITPDWACRAADCATFARNELRDFLRSQGIQLIGYRALQETMKPA